MQIRLSELQNPLQGELIGNDVPFTGISIDTRTLEPGNCFFAIKGPNFDGHAFMDKAKQAGASAVVVGDTVQTSLPVLNVADTRLALGQFGSWYRNKFTMPVIAVTGSAGKTTVREMIASILRTKGEVLASKASLNNDYGVPLTLAKLTSQHDYAVLELGANHPGEIAYLTAMVQPTIALINNVEPAHLEGFESVEGVAKAKSEIFRGLAKEGVAILNADNAHFDFCRTQVDGQHTIQFGTASNADVVGRILHVDTLGRVQFVLQTPKGECKIQLAIPGKHNMMNALAATAVAFSLGFELDEIAQGLQTFEGVQGRMQVKSGIQRARIIDDTYNANISSVIAALKVLAGYSGKRIFVFGDMAELGSSNEAFHRQAGIKARECGIDRVFTCGKFSEMTSAAFGAGAEHFTDHASLIEKLQQQLGDNVTVLVKGSRFMKMEKVVNAITTQQL